MLSPIHGECTRATPKIHLKLKYKVYNFVIWWSSIFMVHIYVCSLQQVDLISMFLLTYFVKFPADSSEQGSNIW